MAAPPDTPPPPSSPEIRAVPDPVPEYVSSDYGMAGDAGGDFEGPGYVDDGVPDFVTAGPPPEDDEGPAGDPDDALDPVPTDFAGVADLAFRRGEAILGATLTNKVHPVTVEPGRLELRPQKGVDSRMMGLLAGHLQRWTGRDWVVELSEEEGGPTLREQKAARKAAVQAELAAHPVVAKVLELFPGAEIDTVVELAAPEPEPAALQTDMSTDPLPAGQANEA